MTDQAFSMSQRCMWLWQPRGCIMGDHNAEHCFSWKNWNNAQQYYFSFLIKLLSWLMCKLDIDLLRNKEQVYPCWARRLNWQIFRHFGNRDRTQLQFSKIAISSFFYLINACPGFTCHLTTFQGEARLLGCLV